MKSVFKEADQKMTTPQAEIIPTGYMRRLTMKKLIIALVLGAVSALQLNSAVYGQTADGETPANEGICDALNADGITKGLYGLCVAFCEAQDHADLTDPVSPEEFNALSEARPAGKILANYNKIKDRADNPNDPTMPCVKVEEPCPCWTAEELASIDGILFDGVQASQVYCDLKDNDYGNYQSSYYRVYEDSYVSRNPRIYTIAYTYEDNFNGRDYARCIFTNLRNNYNGEVISRGLYRQNGELTPQQFVSCQNTIRDHIDLIRGVCTNGTEAP